MIAYFDCFSGISGDMTLAAFIHMGLPPKWLKDRLDLLGMNFDLSVTDEKKSGITGKSVSISFNEKDQPHRHYKDIKMLIESSALSDNVKKRSLDVFDVVAEAESKVHGCDKDHVHFHEVGAVDSVMDIVGFALAMDFFDIDAVYSSSLPLGGGYVQCAHGLLPVPAPAVTAILEKRGDVPIYSGDVQKELVTPTGAAILAATVEKFGSIPPMSIKKTGYGAGKHQLDGRPNMLRILLGEAKTLLMPDSGRIMEKDVIWVVECNMDDMNGEWTGFLTERLMDMGALDVMIIPAQMKKNRPGVLLKILCRRERFNEVVEILFKETTTIGIRYYETSRIKLKRRKVSVKTPLGDIDAKEITGLNGEVRIAPEFETAKQIAVEKNLPLKDVYEIILNYSKKQIC